MKNLVIVESPAKAKTIEKFLGKDYVVKSSNGHIRDLAKKEMSIDIENQYEPEYEITEEKHKLVSELKKAVKEADMVWLASDEDREGEAIAWHLQETLKLNPEHTKRIVFNEITKNAILHAIETPRSIDLNLVDAQQARRVLDRLVGYEISPILWAKIKPALSAGRVQSVAVRLIVEREEEIKNFVSHSYYRVTAQLHPANGRMQVLAELTRLRQICCDPSLLYDDYADESAKREALMDLLRTAVSGGHKVLVFSQFTSMLSLIEQDIRAEGFTYMLLTGDTDKKERLRMANAFNTDGTDLFLISLRAGGTGLNLVGADIVIHYDPWWNLAVEQQATDRAHRIGQTRAVTVYKLIAKDTVEERIIALQDSKRDLAEGILSGEGVSLKDLSKEDLMELIGS